MSEAKKNILILGAGGQIAHWVIEMLKRNDGVKLTLFARHSRKIKSDAPKSAHVVQGTS